MSLRNPGGPGGDRCRRRCGAFLGTAFLFLAAACSSDESSPEPPRTPVEDQTAVELLRFVDRSEAAGLGGFRAENGRSGRRYMVETLGSGLGWIDYDGDGWLDLYVVNGAPLPGQEPPGEPPRNRLFRNRGDGTFEDVTDTSGAAGHTGYGQGCAVGDYDGDGHADLYVTNFGPNALLRNRGDGTFEDVTEFSGTDDERWGASATFFDADADGDLDLYVVNYVAYSIEEHHDCFQPGRGQTFPIYCPPAEYDPTSGVFFRNLGGGRFRDETVEAGLYAPGGRGLGVVATDFDLDGDVDLYVANDTEPNFLFRNEGGRFVEVGQVTGTAFSEDGHAQSGMGVDAGDIDGDGRFDLFVTNYQEESNVVYRNEPESIFNDHTYRARLMTPSLDWLGFGALFFDANGDGDLDLFVANGHVLDNIHEIRPGIGFGQRNQLFANDGRGRFTEISQPGFDQALVSRGVAAADYDRDGDLDLVVSNNGGPLELLRNETPEPGHWLSLELVGTQSHRDAIGARVVARIGDRQIVRERRGGGSYLSSLAPVVHIGCGEATVVDELVIHWPSGHVDRHERIAVDRALRLQEGAGEPEVRW